MTRISMIARIRIGIACLLAFVFAPSIASCAAMPGRTLAELKAEVQARADHQAYPVGGLNPNDVREALGRLTSLNPDDWAATWSVIGDRYMQKAQSELASSPAQADADFVQAWRYYNFGRWPAMTSPGKQAAYKKALEAYAAHGRLLNPPLEIVHIPFEGKEIIGCVQMPKSAKPVPIVIVIAGLDRGKEDMAERFRPILDRGVGYLALDAPGTGQAPIKASPGAERMFLQAIDYISQRPDVDKSRIIVYGASFGAFWATSLAIAAKDKLRAVVAQSPPVHEDFSRAHTMMMPSNREYLFDYVPAYETMFGVTTLDQLADAREKMSLKTRGFLDKPMAPILVIGGALDTQVPIADTDLLLNSGVTPKEAWINPLGGHMGRDAHVWSDARIFNRVTVPWILRMLGDHDGVDAFGTGEETQVPGRVPQP